MNKITTSIIIDSAYREEKRIAVLQNGILQDFDREAISIKQIKGNIYLAKITRVEASLQACFVDYGSDRHGFLPFADIHPDYYQISESERQKLKELNNSLNNNRSEDEDQNYQNNSSNQNRDNALMD
jgi:ribonuclease E